MTEKIDQLKKEIDQVFNDYASLTKGNSELEINASVLKRWIETAVNDRIEEMKTRSSELAESKLDQFIQYFRFMLPINKDNLEEYESIYNIIIDLPQLLCESRIADRYCQREGKHECREVTVQGDPMHCEGFLDDDTLEVCDKFKNCSLWYRQEAKQ